MLKSATFKASRCASYLLTSCMSAPPHLTAGKIVGIEASISSPVPRIYNVIPAMVMVIDTHLVIMTRKDHVARPWMA